MMMRIMMKRQRSPGLGYYSNMVIKRMMTVKMHKQIIIFSRFTERTTIPVLLLMIIMIMLTMLQRHHLCDLQPESNYYYYHLPHHCDGGLVSLSERRNQGM